MTEQTGKTKKTPRAKKIISINLVESNLVEKRIGKYLKWQRDEVGIEIKTLIMDALQGYYNPLAIAIDRGSLAEIESALIESTLSLDHQRNWLIAISETYGVNLRSDCKAILGLGDLHTDRESTVPKPLLQKPTPSAVEVDVEDENQEDDFSTNDFNFGE